MTKQVTVRVHESRHLPDTDVHRQRNPPRVHQDRAAVDAAAGARSDLACRTILAMTVQQRLVSPSTLRALVLPRGNLPRRGLILETLDDIAGGSQSLPELQYLAGLRRFGLPEPTRQRVVAREDGTFYLDADFDLAVLMTADALLSRGWVPGPTVRSRLVQAAQDHPGFTWTTPLVA